MTYKRYKFLQRNQELGETFDAFLMDLKNLISSCKYHADERDKYHADERDKYHADERDKYHADERDNILRDQIVMNIITSNTVLEKLLSKAELKLPETIDICRSSEITGQLSISFLTSIPLVT